MRTNNQPKNVQFRVQLRKISRVYSRFFLSLELVVIIYVRERYFGLYYVRY
jgi:hypothetical protein